MVLTYNFKYSDHMDRFKAKAHDLDVEILYPMYTYYKTDVYIGTAEPKENIVQLSNPSPEAEKRLRDFIKNNNLILVGDAE